MQTVGGHASRPGDFKYKDLNNDGLVNEKDMAPIGYTNLPEYTYGAAFSITYQDLDVSFLFQGVSNVGRYLNGSGIWSGAGFTNYSAWHLDSWSEEKASNGETIRYPRLTTQVSPNEVVNDFFYVNASYVRLRNVEIGYTFPLNWVKSVGLRKARVYANGQNLYTWDRLPYKGVDPEQLSSYAYPIQRVFNFGLNVTF